MCRKTKNPFTSYLGSSWLENFSLALSLEKFIACFRVILCQPNSLLLGIDGKREI